MTAEAKTLQFTPSPSKTSPSYQLPAGLPELSKMSPVVRLKSVITPSRGYQCEQCNEKFTDVSQLIKHKRQHEEEKSIPCEICGKSFTSQDLFKEHQCVCAVESSFSCNMCDRTFSTNHNLKRHKLLHVRDGRKCSQCGVLFCRRHNHTVFIPQAELTAESEEDCSVVESENVESEKLMPENDTVEKLEPSQTDDLADDTPSSQPVTTTTSKCLPKNRRAFPLISSADVLTEIPFPKLIKPFRTSLPLIRATSFQFKPREPPNHPKDFIQPHLARDPEISSSLQIFSPQCLTSALLEVKRNYVYFRRREAKLRMMKKQKEEKEREQEEDKVQVQVKMKEEPCEILAVSPVKPRSKAKVKIERTAYDLEIVL